MVLGNSEFRQRFGKLARELGDASSIDVLVRHLQERRVAAGHVILRQGETSTSLYLIAEGRLELSVRAIDGHPIRLGQYGPGQWVGAAGFIDAQPALLDVVCEREGTLWMLTRDLFDGLTSTAPVVAGALLRTLSLSLAEQLRQCVRPAYQIETDFMKNGTAFRTATREATQVALLRQLYGIEEV